MRKSNGWTARPNLNLLIAAVIASYFSTLPSTALGQEWLNHEYIQPMPQYQGASSVKNRYPLEDSTRTATTPSPQTPVPKSIAQEKAKLPLETLPDPLPVSRPKANASVSPLVNETNNERVQLSINPLSDAPRDSGSQSASPIEKPAAGDRSQPSPSVNSTIPPAAELPARKPPSRSNSAQPPSSVLMPATPSASALRIPSPGSAQPKARPDRIAAKPKVPVHRTPEINYDIYRDLSIYPLDPRKPNNPCTRGPNCGCGSCKGTGKRKTGIKGRPHQPQEPGGYTCGKKCPNKRPQFSMFWPRPFSAKLDECFPRAASRRYEPGQKKKFWDVFDKLTNFTVIDYQRTDNGYSGPGCDPYGCLGESRVFGVGFRLPGDSPNNNPFPYPLGR